eukprot:GHVT01047524.1.p1 GENE.GHVT01047524.1~~GHVT01047524.1.p1  ORF type:complete len:314 (-),score=60.72 GHVT01047524.1:1388-2329(-)
MDRTSEFFALAQSLGAGLADQTASAVAGLPTQGVYRRGGPLPSGAPSASWVSAPSPFSSGSSPSRVNLPMPQSSSISSSSLAAPPLAGSFIPTTSSQISPGLGFSSASSSCSSASFPAVGAFNSLADLIGRDIQGVEYRLSELGRRAKQRSLFDDRSSQFDSLTTQIKQSLTGLNGQLESLEEYAVAAADEAAAAATGGGIWRARDAAAAPSSKAHFTAMTGTLRNQLLALTKQFKDVLQIRSENLKRLDSRRNLYSFAKEKNGGKEKRDWGCGTEKIYPLEKREKIGGGEDYGGCEQVDWEIMPLVGTRTIK